MTEAEWRTSTDLQAMLAETEASDRKLLLFTSLCVRRWCDFQDGGRRLRAEQVAEVTERFADRRATVDEVRQALGPIGAAERAHAREWADIWTEPDAGSPEVGVAERAAWLRDLFANPFRPVAFDPRWRTEDTFGLARGIYEGRAFDRLPLLADALMDAGCADEQVLSHCRSEGPHVRGCWVVDLVLGKE
jgi:hypothetical protein